jgi:hypothetical protein
VNAAAACAAAAADLTELTWRLGQVHETLTEQARTPATDFGGVSGVSYRIHASHSAVAVAELASDVALLAGGLAALGRALADVAGIRAIAAGLPAAEAAEARARADAREHRAQADWRSAVAEYEQRRWPVDAAEQPVVSHPPIRATSSTVAPGPAPAASPAAARRQPTPPPTAARQADRLEAELVGPTYEAEIMGP